MKQNDRQGTLAMYLKMERVYAFHYIAGYKCPVNILCINIVMFGPCIIPLTGEIIILLYFKYNTVIFF